MALPAVLREMLALPTAPFVESAVLAYIRERCAEFAHVRLRRDRCGNLLAHYRNKPRDVPGIVFTAHTDHPGFVASRMLDDTTLLANFRGWSVWGGENNTAFDVPRIGGHPPRRA